MGNLRDESKLRNMQPTDVVLGADKDGCLVNFPPDNFSGSIPITIDTETGDGEELFTEPEVNNFLFKKIKSEDESIEFTTDTDGNIDASVNFPTPPTVDYPVIESEDVGEGVSLRRNLVSKKIGIRTLTSDNFVITEELDGTIKINSAGGGSSTNDWHLDANYTRPSNWTPDETIDGIALPKGTLNDPFLTFDEYLKKTIGSSTGSNINGLYSRVNPRLSNTLKILSDITTDKELEVNFCSIFINNGKKLTYTGTEEYAANTERLWNALVSGGVLTKEIRFTIGGEGTMINRYHAGCILHKTSSTGTTNNIKSILSIQAELSGFTLLEVPDSSTYTLLTREDGSTPLLHGGKQVHGSIEAPTTPLLKIKGKNYDEWGALILGTKFSMQTNIQSHIEVDEDGSITSSCDNIFYMANPNYIGYEKKLYVGLAGMTSDEIELLAGRGDNVFFKPHSSRNVFSTKNNSVLKIDRITTLSDSKYETGVHSIFNLENGSIIYILSKFEELGGGCAVTYINYEGSGNSIKVAGSSQNSHVNYFVKGDSLNSILIDLVDSKINPVYIIRKNTPTLNINTAGTYSAIKNIPINTGLVSIADNATAIAPPYNYIAGMEYFNTTENAVSRVS